MSEEADTTTTTTTAPVPVTEVPTRQSRLTQVVAWVGIIAGITFVVAVIFFSGFILGKHSDGGGYHRGGPDRENVQFHRGGPPMGPPHMFPGGPGGPGSQQGPGPGNPSGSPTTAPRP